METGNAPQSKAPAEEIKALLSQLPAGLEPWKPSLPEADTEGNIAGPAAKKACQHLAALAYLRRSRSCSRKDKKRGAAPGTSERTDEPGN